MKISRTWLQKYFDTSLPEGQELCDAFTFHSFEVDAAEGDMLDLKVLPDRSGYGLCHRGVAYELSAAIDVPLTRDPLREAIAEFPLSKEFEVSVADARQCLRYMGAVVKNVKIGPSPEWLRAALASVGQRSINNVIDATNYVMLNIGQPLHAFDAGKLKVESGKWKVGVRSARAGEKITTLTGEEYELTLEDMLIVDDNGDVPIGIAGVKGGKAAEVEEQTTELVIEAANFDGPSVRRTAQRLKLFTDASLRFQNRPSPELVAYGMRDVLLLIAEVAGGTVEGVVDWYPKKSALRSVSVTLARINGSLGSSFTKEEVERAWRRLSLPFTETTDGWKIVPPFERTDIVIPEDLVEEAGRILGYDRLPPTALLPVKGEPDQARFRGIERIKDECVEQGFTEVSTQSFAKEGEIYLANPLDKNNPALRPDLSEGLQKAVIMGMRNTPLFLEPGDSVKVFEIGAVFFKKGEHLERGMMSSAKGETPKGDYSIVEEHVRDANYIPKRYTLGQFKPFSPYPFIARDIALWVSGAEGARLRGDVERVLNDAAGALRIRTTLFDEFSKDGRTSYAFRLIFQSNERTLTDEEVNEIMERIYKVVEEKGWEVR